MVGFLILVIVLVISYFVAKEFQNIAEEKGYGDSSKYFWYTFLLTPYGMLMVIALPDRGKPAVTNNVRQEHVAKQVISDELPDL